MKRTFRLSTFMLALPLILLSAVTGQQADGYALRREALLKMTGKGIVIIPGKLRTPYGHSDESSSKYFYYMTGWDAPGAMMVLEPGHRPLYTLFVTPSDPSRATWDDSDPGLSEAKNNYGADTALIFSTYRKEIKEKLLKYDTIWYISSSKLMYETLSSLVPDGKDKVIMDLREVLRDMRLVKDEYELRCLTTAIETTSEALRQAMMLAEAGRWEYELEAAIDHTFRSGGCDGTGFTTIIGSGANSTVLHYDSNSSRLTPGEVIVMDVGAKYKGYTADITRTIPVSGSFTAEQLDIYNIVLEAQKEAIDEMKPGKRTLGPHDRASEVIMSGLFRLGLVTDTTCQWQRDLYVLYTATHHIGLDVHDLYPYQLTAQDESTFKPGMVITIEPGIYIREDMLDKLEKMASGHKDKEKMEAFIMKVKPLLGKYKNTGIRIEDDILITAGGNKVLS